MLYNGAVAMPYKHTNSLSRIRFHFACRVCGKKQELCYLRERGEVRGQEPQELLCSSAAATRKVAFLILSPSPGTQQEKSFNGTGFYCQAEK